MKSGSFHIINAAAGSGKTYTLVYAYLRKLLSSPKEDIYKNMLALTFTNKAVNEMKYRILNSLFLLAYNHEDLKIKDIRSSLIIDLKMDWPSLQQKATRALNKILHEYAAFEVITLDSFTLKIIKSFAKDLKIPASFEVVLDSDPLLDELIENIIDQAGIDNSLTKILVAFSLTKIDELKSWNIGKDLFDFSKLLLNENDRLPIAQLRGLTSEDFERHKNSFNKLLINHKKELVHIGESTLKLITDRGLSENDFSRKTLFKHFKKIADGEIDDLYKNQLELNLTQGAGLYTKSLLAAKKNSIDLLIPQLFKNYKQAQSTIGRTHLLKNIINQWTPLSLIGKMGEGLEALQIPENRLLISRFNEIIDKEISDLDAPYIYERMGERYRDYFIDEFQDTSRLQWKNLLPLISNALQGLDDHHHTGSLLLVGDPKQAIYRWRGGDNEQFLKLLNKETPFQVKPHITNLPTNYRSREAIVDFNNQFFSWTATHLTDPNQQQLFEQQTQQLFNDKKGGFVVIRFIEKGKNKESTLPHYQEQTIHSLNAAKSNGFSWEDMAVLVRKKEQASQIAAALQVAEIPFVSSESLSLGSSSTVNFLIALIRLVIDPEDDQQKRYIIEFLHDNAKSERDLDETLFDAIFKNIRDFQRAIEEQFGFVFDFQDFSKKSIYNAVEYAIASFGLDKNIGAHLIAFLDDVFEYSSKEKGSFLSYLSHWDHKGITKNIVLPEGTNAVRIMTIHKAKGLEFEVVVMPFASEDLVPSFSRKVWFPVQNFFETDFQHGLISFSSKLNYLGEEGKAFYEQALLADRGDSINTLYVALTRAVSQMHIICTLERESAAADKSFATLFNQFVRQQKATPDIEKPFFWGRKVPNQKEENKSDFDVIQPQLMIQPDWQKKLWIQMNTKHEEGYVDAKQEGLLVHELLAKIQYAYEVQSVVEDAQVSGVIGKEERDHYLQMVTNIVEHPEISAYFDEEVEVFNERDILIPNDTFVRPDRIIKKKNSWVILDYKTGKQHPKHITQINHYREILEQMTQETPKCFLVYIGKKATVKQIA